jgi:hypothetical protein
MISPLKFNITVSVELFSLPIESIPVPGNIVPPVLSDPENIIAPVVVIPVELFAISIT